MDVKRSRATRAVVRALLAVLAAGFFAAALPAVATAAPAYPIHHCDVTIKPASGVVKAGGTIQVSGSYYISTMWTVTFNGKTEHFTGKTFTTTLRAPLTKTDKTITLTVSCGNGNTSPFTIQVLGSGTGGGGHLPNTGGPSIWWLILAALAGVSGSILMWRGRRRPKAQPVAASAGKHALRR
jgi:LPXTG-motif cell wall-anchored protein